MKRQEQISHGLPPGGVGKPQCIARLLALAVAIFLSGCTKNFGIPDEQLMAEPVNQCQPMNAPADLVWQCVCQDVREDPGRKVLVEQPRSRLMSWCEKIENWRDLAQDAVGTRDSLATQAPRKYKELAQEPGRGTALTTVWVEASGVGSRLHVRRVFYGLADFVGVGHSRGDFERAFCQRIQQRLAGATAPIRASDGRTGNDQ